jgi:isoleucyl-tRNA synthetase
LSAFFFDIRKDSLYCDAADDPKRRSYRTVLDTLFHALVRYAAPVLVFTAEEVWGTRYPDGGSVHLLEWPEIGGWNDQVLIERWMRLRDVRRVAMNAIERLRDTKGIGSGLEADLWIGCGDADRELLGAMPLSEVFINARTELVNFPEASDRSMVPEGVLFHFLLSVPGVAAGIRKTSDYKCGRCWRHLPEVAEDGALCDRCERVVGDVVNG